MWSNQQKAGLKEVDKWIKLYYGSKKKDKQFFYLGGFAGTGKTTLAKHFAENIDGDVFFAAFTGKAALVMRQNGCIGARTIHSLLYIAEQDPKTGEVTFRLNRNSPLTDAKLIIIDECSMVDKELAMHLLSFGKPILVLGDPGQLPPVSGTGYFTAGEPDFMLTEIHRQADGNPIIHLATQIREGFMPAIGQYGESVIKDRMSKADVLETDQVLVGRNITRSDLNTKIRKMKGLDPDMVQKGDRVICLQNDKDLVIFNGGIFDVVEVTELKRPNFVRLFVNSQDEERPTLPVTVHKSFFVGEVPVPDWRVLKGTQQFDYGYCLTGHKSQGSQWDSVTILDESWCFKEDRWKWLYTCVTRAANRVTLIRN